MPNKENALPGREDVMPITNLHFVKQSPLLPPFLDDLKMAMFGMGCFWGAEKKFWTINSFTTAVGYSAGLTKNPTYQEVCSGQTGHNEVVLVLYDEQSITYQQLLEIFWTSHNPTQGHRQGNDVGTQYRSGIYFYNDEQKKQALESKEKFQTRLNNAKHTDITTEIIAANTFYYAEDYHQQYLAKNPNGYCGLGGLSV